jgi:LacI family transcriptional regulator
MTVSRMLNQSCKVAPATRQRIQKVMDELRYRPSLLARGLASRKTRILGLMIFDQLNLDFLQPIFLGVEHEARQSGYDLLIFSRPGGKEGRENRCLGLVDGVLCLGYEMDNRAVEGLEERGIPCVVIGRREWRRAAPRSVCLNYYDAYRDLTRRLLGLGHRNFAFMGGSGDYYVDREKREGFRAALGEAGLPGERAPVFDDGEAARVRELLEEYRPTAVVLENTVFPLPLLLSVRELG